MEIFSVSLIDIFLILSIVIFIYSSHGFIESLCDLITFIGSLYLAYRFSPLVAALLLQDRSLPVGIAHASAFFIVWLFCEALLFVLCYVFLLKILFKYRNNIYNHYLRFIPATAHALIMYLFFVSLLFSLPVSGNIKYEIIRSRSGPIFIRYSQNFEKMARNLFGKAILESINFLSIKQGASESRNLNINVGDSELIYDTMSESKMFEFVNSERSKYHRNILSLDPNLRNVARKYAKEMLKYSFFSHVSKVDGSTVSERVTREGIVFIYIGENLAYSPDVYLAHEGLMNSEGHRENILSDKFGRIGIGVIDAGIWGKMFVQVFSD